MLKDFFCHLRHDLMLPDHHHEKLHKHHHEEPHKHHHEEPKPRAKAPIQENKGIFTKQNKITTSTSYNGDKLKDNSFAQLFASKDINE